MGGGKSAMGGLSALVVRFDKDGQAAHDNAFNPAERNSAKDTDHDH